MSAFLRRHSPLVPSVMMSIGSPLELRDVYSTHIHTIRYEPARRSLWVRFRRTTRAAASGLWYEYLNVPAHHFDGITPQAAGAQRERDRRHPKGRKPFSVGTYFHEHIEGVYQCVPHPAESGA
jgi:hypothetical protein